MIQKLKRNAPEIPQSKQYNFRKMTKVNSKLNKRPVKRLQAGPKKTESRNHQRLENSQAVEKLVDILLDENMGLTMSRARDKFLREESRKKSAGKISSRLEEQCLEMLGTLRVEEGAEMMEVARDDPAPDQAQAAAEDDHWLDDQWEDFASLEEEDEMIKQITEAENILMMKYQAENPPPKYPAKSPARKKTLKSSPTPDAMEQ